MEQRIAASPATVFSYLTDPEKFVLWMGARAQIDPRPGGVIRIEVDGEHVATGEYREVDPPHRIVFSWGWEASADVPPGSTTVEITLTAEGEGTVLRLRHMGLPTVEQSSSHRNGWVMYGARINGIIG